MGFLAGDAQVQWEFIDDFAWRGQFELVPHFFVLG